MNPTHKSNTTLFFINQIRMKIGVMLDSPETIFLDENEEMRLALEKHIRIANGLDKAEDGTELDQEGADVEAARSRPN